MNDQANVSMLELEPLRDYRAYPEDEMRERARWFYRDIARRRSVREFDSRPVPREVIEQCLLAAGTAPSGANQQPWHFAVITDATRKKRIREAAEAEEREFYEHRAPREWLDALAWNPLAILVGVGLTGWAIVSAGLWITRRRRRIVTSPGERLALRLLAVAALVANWTWLFCHGA